MKRRAKRPDGDLVPNQTAIADVIAAHFKIPCSRQSIRNWQRQWSPSFPLPTTRNQYSKSDCFAWIKKNYLPKFKKEADGDDLLAKASAAVSGQKILDFEEKQFDLALKRGEYVERTKARGVISAALKKYHGIVTREIEVNMTGDRREKLALLGVSAEQIAAFHEWDIQQAQAMTDRIEARCEQETKEAEAVEI